ncbi:Ribosome-binding factor A [bioreactor metagenome]|uniref:Ribosome-binding factor A n=1 Tax=bioreactor metagenome TaxID=1076179 RepID=A0A645B6V2_9ZZZZ
MSGAPDRLTRVNELLKRVLGEQITRGLIAPSPSVLVSVTEVRTSVDLRNATVSVSVFGGGRAERRQVLENLNAARKELQHDLAHELGFKHTPVLTFRLDTRVAAGDRVLAILGNLEREAEHDDHDDR